MEQEVNATAPFLLVQKPRELIRLFEGMIDQKIREVITTNIPTTHIYSNQDSPFLNLEKPRKLIPSPQSKVTSLRHDKLTPGAI